MIQSKQTLHFKPIPIEGSWMVGLTDLEKKNSIFNKKIVNSIFINILMKKLVVFHTQSQR